MEERSYGPSVPHALMSPVGPNFTALVPTEKSPRRKPFAVVVVVLISVVALRPNGEKRGWVTNKQIVAEGGAVKIAVVTPDKTSSRLEQEWAPTSPR